MSGPAFSMFPRRPHFPPRGRCSASWSTSRSVPTYKIPLLIIYALGSTIVTIPVSIWRMAIGALWTSQDQLSGSTDCLGSKITLDEESFCVTLDVPQFSLDEISVKVEGRELIVEGSQPEKEDLLGSVSHHFFRSYILPEGHLAEDVTTSFSANGQLTIMVPKKQQSEVQERIVPITLTGKPHEEAPEESEQNNEA